MNFSFASFFAGVGTVLVTLALGFGGGVLITGAFTGDARQPNKLEQRALDPGSSKSAPAPVIAKVPEPQVQAAVATPSPAVAEPLPPSTPAVTPPPQAQPASEPVARASAQPLPSAPPQVADQQPIGPERTVSLAQPPEEQQLSRRQMRAQQAKARAEKRKAERRMVAERRQQFLSEQETRSFRERRSQQAYGNDDEDRPMIVRRERLFDAPRFRFFNNWD